MNGIFTEFKNTTCESENCTEQCYITQERKTLFKVIAVGEIDQNSV